MRMSMEMRGVTATPLDCQDLMCRCRGGLLGLPMWYVGQ